MDTNEGEKDVTQLVRQRDKGGKDVKKVRNARLRWFGCVLNKNSEYIGKLMIKMELPGRR